MNKTIDEIIVGSQNCIHDQHKLIAKLGRLSKRADGLLVNYRIRSRLVSGDVVQIEMAADITKMFKGK